MSPQPSFGKFVKHSRVQETWTHSTSLNFTLFLFCAGLSCLKSSSFSPGHPANTCAVGTTRQLGLRWPSTGRGLYSLHLERFLLSSHSQFMLQCLWFQSSSSFQLGRNCEEQREEQISSIEALFYVDNISIVTPERKGFWVAEFYITYVCTCHPDLKQTSIP